MNIITWIALIIAIYAFIVAKNAHKRIDDTSDKKRLAQIKALKGLLGNRDE